MDRSANENLALEEMGTALNGSSIIEGRGGFENFVAFRIPYSLSRSLRSMTWSKSSRRTRGDMARGDFGKIK